MNRINREDLEKLSTEDLVAITLADMKMRLVGYRNFLEQMVILRVAGMEAVARDQPANTPGEAATKQVASRPGLFTDSRIADLPLPLAKRLVALAERLAGKIHIEDVEIEELSALLKDIKQFGEDIQPVYDWHAELRAELLRADLALN